MHLHIYANIKGFRGLVRYLDQIRMPATLVHVSRALRVSRRALATFGFDGAVIGVRECFGTKGKVALSTGTFFIIGTIAVSRRYALLYRLVIVTASGCRGNSSAFPPFSPAAFSLWHSRVPFVYSLHNVG